VKEAYINALDMMGRIDQQIFAGWPVQTIQ